MNDDVEQYCLAPVEAGMCRYESLIDGTLGLHDIAAMNEYLVVRAENDWRAHEAARETARGS